MKDFTKRPKAFVQLASGFGATNWSARWDQGKIVGKNERYPYGYFHAEKFGFDVSYSDDFPENPVEKLIRYGVRFILGFDLIHAWRNRQAMLAADIVWTHTESQSLAVLMVLRLLGVKKPPKLIMQSVWLIDRWPRLSALHRYLYRHLLKKADILTFLSDENRGIAQKLFPFARCELVLFGIKVDPDELEGSKEKRPLHSPVRVIAIGNDVHRDWTTLAQALRMTEGVHAKIVSRTAPPSTFRGLTDVELVAPSNNAELDEIFDWADIGILPLTENLHASGITVLQEYALHGLPAICTDVGGLRSYFSDDDVVYVSARDPQALAGAIREAARGDPELWRMAGRARARMGPEQLSSEAFARRHVEISRDLLGLGSTRAPHEEEAAAAALADG